VYIVSFHVFMKLYLVKLILFYCQTFNWLLSTVMLAIMLHNRIYVI